jgi:hypothetical protein
MTKYFITFIDDKSRKTIVYFLKCKSEAYWGKELKTSKVMEVENTFLMNLKNFVNNTISLNFWDGFHDLVDLHGAIFFFHILTIIIKYFISFKRILSYMHVFIVVQINDVLPSNLERSFRKKKCNRMDE